MSDSGFSLAARARSFHNAGRGIWDVLRTQHNARIHVVASLAVCAAGLALDVSRGDWAALVLAMTLVWVAESLNTALERLGDAVSPTPHPLVGRAKDAAAGAVLLAAVGAGIVGLLVLGPPLCAALR
jgi:diacylglycerol kinase (ATP)